MTRKLTLTAAFMLGFLSLGIIADSVTSGSIFINEAFARETSSNGGGNGASGKP